MIDLPVNELEDYCRKLTAPEYEGDLKTPITEREIFWQYARHQCRNNLWLLNKCVLIDAESDRTYKPLHKDMCDFVQNNRPNPLLLLIPRKNFKSKLITSAVPIQEILRNPNVSILLGHQTETGCKKFLYEIKAQFEQNIRLRALFPDIIPDNPFSDSEKWAADALIFKRKTVRKDATIEIASLDKPKTGTAAEVVILDDMFNERIITSRAEYESMQRFFDYCRFLVNPNQWRIIIGTVYDFSDYYNTIITGKNSGVAEFKDYKIYLRRSLEGDYVERILRQLEGGDEAQDSLENIDTAEVLENLFKYGKPIFPQNDRYGKAEFDKENLRKFYLNSSDGGEVSFYKQMMNFAIEPKAQTFQRRFVKMHNWQNQLKNPAVRYIICDPSQDKALSDPTSIVDFFPDTNEDWYFGPDIIYEKLSPSKIIEALIERIVNDQYKQYPLAGVAIETVFYQGVLKTDLEKELANRKLNVYVIEVEPRGRAKSDRILGVQPRWKRGGIILPNTDQMLKILDTEIYRWRPSNKNAADHFLDCIAYAGDLMAMFGYPKTRRPQESHWRQEAQDYWRARNELESQPYNGEDICL